MNAFRLAVVSVQGQLRVAPRTALVADVRSANLEKPWVHALFLRGRPFSRLPLDVQLGRMPSVFGAYARHRYLSDSPLIGQPLAYQYLTSLRPDAKPATADGFRVRRGAGWRPYYVVGAREPRTGLPLVNGFLRDTGVGLRAGDGKVELSLALTQVTLGNPRVADDNSGKQLVGHLRWRPSFGLVVGASAARGEYLDRTYAKDSLVLCYCAWPIMDSFNTEDHVGDPALESRLFSAVTGREMDEALLDQAGERIFNLYRAILLREGRNGRGDDYLPESLVYRAGGAGV